MTLEETLKQIKPLNEEKMKTARRRWDSIAKPLHSLGKMEDLITQIVGITGDEKVDLGKKGSCCHVCRQWRGRRGGYPDRTGSHCNCSR
ncbi:MAG: nicotinate-nucleotide--dimethylbenzimidazole phosphoribosyltransferase [Ruminococcus sp.]